MSAVRIIAVFNLKPGVDVAAYEAWAREVDLPTVNKLGSIAKFEVFKTTSVLGSDAAPPYQYIEVIDVKDVQRFGDEVSTSAMQAVAAAFQSMADVTFMTTENLVA